MKNIAFIGAGKIGKAMVSHVLDKNNAKISFIYNPSSVDEAVLGVKIVRDLKKDMLSGLDLVVECATPQALKDHLEDILSSTSLMPFSMTAFGDAELLKKAQMLSQTYGTSMFLPHGAILGLDGIFDGREAFEEVTVETIKNPASFGRDDKELTVLFEGPTLEAVKLYPRNVNVHAAVALAGIGFERTRSKMTADPSVHTNSHLIHLKGKGIDFTIHVSSFSDGGVSGKYVPLSACGSLDRVLGGSGIKFV